MQLKLKYLRLFAGRPIAVLNHKTAAALNAHVDDRIVIEKENKSIICLIDLSSALLREGEVAVSQEVLKYLAARNNSIVEVSLAPKPESISFIHKKLDNHSLTSGEINAIIKDIVSNALSESEIAYFVSAMYTSRVSIDEIADIIRAIVSTGNRLVLHKKIIADKHSIGGVPGNRTTPIMVPICAAAGLTIPKTSSRAITTAAGTADVMETICDVEFSIYRLQSIIEKTNACLAWGGSLGLAPADDKLIQVERLLNLDPEPQLLASILAKKIAVGSKYVLIDIPYGEYAKVSRQRALNLKSKFEKLAKIFNIKMRVVLTDGSQPIGNGIGPVLEVKDVLAVLRQQNAPEDLQKKSIFLAGQLLELTGKAARGRGVALALGILKSGRAFAKFREIVAAQGGHLDNLPVAKLQKDILSPKTARIKEINNKKISALARIAGCPVDKAAGIYLYKHVGSIAEKGEKLFTIYSESKSRLKNALHFLEKNPVITIG